MAKRKYNEQDFIRLLVASGGRCHICNEDIMNDWRTGMPMNKFEKAHIKSFSDNGSRADISLSEDERNATDNLLVLCSVCHTVIDKRIAEKYYSVPWLLDKRTDKEKRIRSVLEILNDEDCLFVKYSSSIDTQNSNFTDESIRRACFFNGFFSHDGIINLSEDTNSEDILQSVKLLDDKFDSRIQRLIDGGEEKTICLFARAPQPLLMYLGTKFNDKHKVVIFTSHRNLEWKFDDRTKRNMFTLGQPIRCKGNAVALALCTTANIQDERIIGALGANVDIWRISAEDVGVDKINNQEDIRMFYNACVAAFDAIGEFYGKDKEVNVFSAVCNSLAVTFGRAIFKKSHNKVNIYDMIKQNGVIQDVLRLTIY